MGEIREVGYRWTDESARINYEALAELLREMQRKRAVDLGMGEIEFDNMTATELKRHYRPRLSPKSHADISASWQKVMDPLIAKMATIHGTFTVPYILIDD